MTDARVIHVTAALPDGRIMVAGGLRELKAREGSSLASADLVDPATGQASPAGLMSTSRVEAVAVVLPDGRVLIAGGWQYQGSQQVALATAEVYEP
jgi:hypothetical protein